MTTTTTTTTMQAAVVTEFGKDLEIQTLPVPMPGRGEALVKVLTTGVCHTDLHAAEGDWPVKPTPPFIPGHEGVGEVVALGEGVTDLAIGDLVGNAWLWSACGDCQYCRTGWETLCEAQQNAGYSVDGSLGEYMLVDTRFAARIPAGSDPVEVAPVLCAGVTVYKGLKMTEARPGQWVTISGIGGLGHIAVQYAVAMGLRVAAVDIADDKLALAKKHGAELTVNALHEDPPKSFSAKPEVAMESWSRRCTRQRSARRSGWPAGAERLCSTACRRVTSRRRSSRLCSRA